MKVPEKPEKDKVGFYRIELTDDGFEHFVSEFEDGGDSYKDFLLVTFKQINDNRMSKQSSSLNEILFHPTTSSTSNQSQSEQERQQWDELSKRLMNSMQISQPLQVPHSRTVHPIEIISVSEDSDRIQWDIVRNNNRNLKMVIARSTAGLNLDKDFYYNYRSMISLKFQQIGVYHHFIGGPRSPSPEEQFKFLKEKLENVEYNKKNHLIGIAVQTGISSEYNADAEPLTFTAKLSIFVNLLLKNDFMRPIIYCNNNSWSKLIDPTLADELFSKLPLWIANYTEDPNPDYPGTWKSRGIKWWMWQYSDKGVMDGMINPVYCSRRNKLYSIQDDMFRSAV
uniref:Lysozyme M1 n=1 Tax=Meloidogyne hapla TaxID=6305 RepID=A0A1I8BBU7_MELHA